MVCCGMLELEPGDAFEKYYDKPIGVARVLSILGLSETSAVTPTSAVAASSV